MRYNRSTSFTFSFIDMNTILGDALEDESVTIRDRDTMEQVRVKIDELSTWLEDKMEF